MEENTRSIREHYDYFAYFLNKATSNVFAILNHAAKKIGRETQKKDTELYKHSILKNLNDPNSDGLRWELLSRRLPLLKSLQYQDVDLTKKEIGDQYLTVNENPNLQEKENKNWKKDLPEDFITLIKFLGHTRNYFTHYYPDSQHDEKAAPESKSKKESAYSKYKREEKENFDFEKVVGAIWNKGIAFSYQRFDYIKPKRYSWLIKKMQNKCYYHDFIEKINQNDELSQNGLAYFICLFLEKKDAFDFLKKLEGFKQSGNKKETAAEKVKEERFQATLLTYTVFCCHLPKPALDVVEEKPRIKLLSELLGELVKCPEELFKMLSEKDKKQFKYDIQLDRVGNTEANLADQQDETFQNDDPPQTETYLRRFRDRFPYLALRFIEEMDLFPGLRFHIDLGRITLSHKFKDDKGKVSYDHEWTKDVHTFGRLSKFREYLRNYEEETKTLETNKEKGEAIDQIDQYPTEESRIIDQYDYFAPHYHIVDNEIQFVFKTEEEQIPTPKKTEKDQADGKFYGLALAQRIHSKPYKISVYDLAALVFWKLKIPKFDLETHIEKNIVQKYERFLHDAASGKFTSENYEDFGKKLHENYQFKRRWIPKEIRRCLANHQLDYSQIIKDKIQKERKATQERLENLKNEPPKPGNMADFLAKDMIRIMSPKSELKSQIRPEQYQQLQRNLAYFGVEKQEALKLLKEELKLTTGPQNQKHPFLRNVLKKYAHFKTLKCFYKSYLEGRGYFLKRLEMLQKPSFQQIEKYPFLNLPYEGINGKKKEKEYDLAYLKRYVTRYEKDKNTRVFTLPKGFLNELIKRNEKVENEGVSQENNANFIYTILQNYTDYQPFYDCKREVRINMKKDGVKKGNSEDLQKEYRALAEKWEKGKPNETKRIWAKKILKPEQKIRLYKVQDIVAFEMAKCLASRLEDEIKIDTSGWSLKAVRYKDEANTEKNILDKPIPVSFQKKNQPTVVTITSLKKYGKIFTFLRSKRVSELLKHLSDQKIELYDLEKVIEDLDNYGKKGVEKKNDDGTKEKISESVFKNVMELEKKCHELGFKPNLKKYENEPEKEYQAYQHTHYLKYLKGRGIIDKNQETKMNAIRNMYCHSGFIKYGLPKPLELKDIVKLVIEWGQEYDKTLKKMDEKLKK